MLAMIAGYVLYNHHEVGAFLPTSGSVKAGFGLIENAKWCLKLFLPVITGAKPSMLEADQGSSFAAVYVRVMQMVVPALICGVEAFRQMRREGASRNPLIVGLCVGVVLKAAYNFIVVRPFYQGEWYYAVSFAIANLVLAVWIDGLLQRVSVFLGAVRSRTSLVVSWTAYALITLLSFNIFISYRNSISPPSLLRTLHDGDALREELLAAGYRNFVEFDDGALGFSFHMPSTAGFGLALDPQAVRALRTGGFLDLMDRRGIRLFVAAGVYADELDGYTADEVWKTGVPFNEIDAAEFARFRLRPIGHDAQHGLAFYVLEPKSSSGKQTSSGL